MWAITKCDVILAGLPHFAIVTDHHPLMPIFKTHRLDEIKNPRLQRSKTKIMGYLHIHSKLAEGTLNNAPNTLSHNPTVDPQLEEALAESEIDKITAMSAAEIRAVTSTDEPLQITKFYKVTDNNPEYQKLKSYITS